MVGKQHPYYPDPGYYLYSVFYSLLCRSENYFLVPAFTRISVPVTSTKKYPYWAFDSRAFVDGMACLLTAHYYHVLLLLLLLFGSAPI
jgi:hypothetical protein